MYPLKFKEIYHKKIWGGRDLGLIKENLPEGRIGESWEVACHPKGTSIISNGEFRGMGLDQLIKLKGEELIGTHIQKDSFPLLIKLINAKDKLSVQVHPNDEYGKKTEGEMGKTEVWYVMEAKEGANLIVGTKNISQKEEFQDAIENGGLDQYLNKVPVKKGDVIFIKSGLIHAIGEGVLIAEIQQNSDTTYRVYDYNRGRDIHINKALDVVDLNLKGEKSKGIRIYGDGYTKTYLCLGKDFSLELYDIEDKFEENSDIERFYIFTCVDGQGELIYKDGKDVIQRGESILIPASLGHYIFKGKLKVLKSYVPDINRVEREILGEIER
ncbi:mannose-6-phosphate isomerase, class I [Wukongibacter baidiensis]|uniref:mannose-6-phosphate isomerase, class I n=1 Tax=Wukongibacter baidiensis TaxID=1723361 RepID=UPI003D7F4B3C